MCTVYNKLYFETALKKPPKGGARLFEKIINFLLVASISH